MAQKVRLDALEDQKRDVRGAPANEQSLKEIAQSAVAAARGAMPDGLPPASQYASLSIDEVIAEAARYGFRLGNFVTEDELRLVTEYARRRHSEGQTPKTRAAAPPVPMQPAPQARIRGLKPSPSNTWRVECPVNMNNGSMVNYKQVSVGGGQMANMRHGAIVSANHYSPQVLQSMVDQGLKLIPLEDPETEE